MTIEEEGSYGEGLPNSGRLEGDIRAWKRNKRRRKKQREARKKAFEERSIPAEGQYTGSEGHNIHRT